MLKRKIVLKIGGSVLYNKDLNVNFGLLKKVKDWYYRTSEEYLQRVIVVGGGYFSRELQRRISSEISAENDLHNISMSITQTSAELVRAYIGDSNIFVPKKLGDAYEYLVENNSFSVVSGGLKIGWSTDMDSAVFADIMEVDRVYKISNVDYLYDVDPDINENAKVIKDISWNGYFSLFDISKDAMHEPNSSIPVDRECSLFCNKKRISFLICGGNNLASSEKDLENILSDGTLIHP
ncbi:MAG TPA: hypothetical protein PLS56_03015 [Candidatus Dojkabacteria bacterium]|nr:hypothetical protein [Candidatus Dojkabacteria bacterium]